MKRALITGFAGFVGRHFTKRLSDDGWEVTGVDDFSTGLHPSKWMSQPIKVSMNTMGLREYALFRPDVSDFDLIIHCAAVVGGRQKIEGDPIAVATDLAIDADFWQWVVRSKNKKQKIVYFSSSAVYPVELQRERMHCTLTESLVSMSSTRFGMPDLTYGWAKLTGEYLAQHAVKTYGTNCVIYRPFSGYGEDQDLSYPFPAIIQRVVRRENPIEVWGSGDQVRDFIHISDVVEGVLSTMHVLPPGGVMNLGSGVGVSFKELVEIACELLGHKADIRPDTSKPSGVHRRQADTFFMRQHFQPKVGLEEGIIGVAKHLQKQNEHAN